MTGLDVMVEIIFQKDAIIVLLTLTKGMMTLNIRNLSKFELKTCEVIEITKYEKETQR